MPDNATLVEPTRTARKPLDVLLREKFGFDSFRPGQETVIRQLLAGNSALAVFPTGAGKSLCFQLSALQLDGLTLVVSPLIALMKDQIDFLQRRGLPAARLDSTVKLDDFRRIGAQLRAGELKLLYVAPERFANERFIQKLRGLKIALMVVDEAHCISEWGHNFRPDYLKLARLARDLRVERVLALTATATPAVAADICKEFGIAKDAFVHTGFYRPNLLLRVTACPRAEQLQTLLRRLRERPGGPTIIYVTLQRTAETVAAELVRNGFSARAYHAGMENNDRHLVQDWFMNAGDAIVVATIAFGMGIDKADIRYVYHFNLPKSLEHYSQEIGRAGRDGKESTCEMLACADDIIALENFSFGDTPEAENVSSIVDELLQNTAEFDVSFYELSRAHDVRPLVVTTLFTYLELVEIIQATGPFYSEYQFQPLKSSAEILAQFDGERAAFLRKVFAGARKAQKWFYIDLETTAQRLQTTRAHLVETFTALEESGNLALKLAGLRQGYRIKKRPADVAGLKRTLTERFEARERNDLARVRQVLALAGQRGCLVRALLAHFGEELRRDCGHCGSCLGEPRGSAGLERQTAIPNVERAQIASLVRNFPKALGTARQIARFLCGISSPRVIQSKLSKDPLFGSLAEVPFGAVMSIAAQLPRAASP